MEGLLLGALVFICLLGVATIVGGPRDSVGEILRKAKPK